MTIPAPLEKAINNNDEADIELVQAEEESSESIEREYPSPFYDPTTGRIMKEPVVNPVGDSYDKSSLPTVDDPTITYYPNRALQCIIERELALNEKSITGSLRRFDDALQRGWSRLVDQSAFGKGEYRPLPESYYCPITCDLIVDPVITPDGISYEREAIVNWVRVNGTSPVTRNNLSIEQLRSNNNLYDLIQNEKERTLESIHPSIRRWKESGIRTTRPDVIPDNIPTPTAPPASDDISNNQSTAGNNNAGTNTLSPEQTTQQQPTTTTTYPTTQAQIDQRRRQQRANQTMAIILCFTLILIFLFVPYFGTFATVLVVIFLLSACSNSRRQRRQQQ